MRIVHNLLRAVLVTALALTSTACMKQNARSEARLPSIDGIASKRLAESGREASITVLPTSLAGHPSVEVGQVVAILLEKRGMDRLALAEHPFTPPKHADMPALAVSLAEHVRAQQLPTDFALFTEMLGTPGRPIDEVRILVLDRNGAVAWADTQGKGSRAFDRASPGEPLAATMFMVDRLRPLLNLDSRERSAVGPIEGQWKIRTGLPTDAERTAMDDRLRAFASSSPSTTLAVYRPIDAAPRVASASALAAMISDQQLFRAVPVELAPPAGEQGMNQQRALWSLAAQFSEFLRANPPETEYALAVEYARSDNRIVGVQLVICTAKGEIVAADLQNDHLPDFQAMCPKSSEVCDRLVVRRLAALRR